MKKTIDAHLRSEARLQKTMEEGNEPLLTCMELLCFLFSFGITLKGRSRSLLRYSAIATIKLSMQFYWSREWLTCEENCRTFFHNEGERPIYRMRNNDSLTLQSFPWPHMNTICVENDPKKNSSTYARRMEELRTRFRWSCTLGWANLAVKSLGYMWIPTHRQHLSTSQSWHRWSGLPGRSTGSLVRQKKRR